LIVNPGFGNNNVAGFIGCAIWIKNFLPGNMIMITRSLGSLLLVLTILFRCFRSIKLLLATLITLLMGLTLTAGFAAIAIGHLNVISVSFAALYIGLGVDFAIHMNLHYRAQLVKGNHRGRFGITHVDRVGIETDRRDNE
jgi:predicted RND superfamily exporter protein